ncbi:hypothetical protein [Aquisalimonas asiatica]|uniref:Pre-peptidase C-terminal domain-containing protein n=1 Tax=Aquisalimonas asiatica TaxID=406100 RepID=A0A1H8TQE2_9GAMM|nr:hypothetical protein [Aquisalimonas asiatica]SEO92834.1 hypothetical protein SAMN04488052_104365 [Aquisalimonas asiatica]
MRFTGGIGVVVGGGLVLAGGVVGLLLAQTGALPQGGETDTDTPEVPSLTPGDTAEGELTTRSPYNPNSGSRYQRFRVEIPAGDVVTFELNTGFPGVLALYDERGNQMVTAQEGRPGTGCYRCSRHERNPVMTYRSTEGGVYDLTVSAEEADEFGPVRVETDTMSLDSDDRIVPEEAFPAWFDGDRTRLGFDVDTAGYYRVDLEAAHDIVALVANPGSSNPIERRAGADGRLSLYAWFDEGEQELALKDYGYRPPVPGIVTLEAHAVDTDAPAPADREATLRDGETTGFLQSDERVAYTLELDEASAVAIVVQASEFSPEVQLEGEQITLSAGPDWRTEDAIIEDAFPAGEYQLELAASQGTGGRYTVDVVTRAYDDDGDADLEPGVALQGRRHGERDSVHALVIEEAGHYIIDMESNDFDTYLTLTGDDVHIENDDGGEQYNARIHALLEPGEYEVVAGAFGQRERGAYTLEATAETLGDVDALRGPASLGDGESVAAVVPSGERNEHTVVIPESGEYRIELDAADFHAEMLLSGEGVEAYAPEGVTSVTRTPVMEESLEAGEYQLRVYPLVREEGGAYQLDISR